MGTIQIKGSSFGLVCGFETRIGLSTGLFNRSLFSQDLLEEMLQKFHSGDVTVVYDEKPPIISHP